LAEQPRITAFYYLGQTVVPSQRSCLLEQVGKISGLTGRHDRSCAAEICKSELPIHSQLISDIIYHRMPSQDAMREHNDHIDGFALLLERRTELTPSFIFSVIP
jgi:hypothetical protein